MVQTRETDAYFTTLRFCNDLGDSLSEPQSRFGEGGRAASTFRLDQLNGLIRLHSASLVWISSEVRAHLQPGRKGQRKRPLALTKRDSRNDGDSSTTRERVLEQPREL